MGEGRNSPLPKDRRENNNREKELKMERIKKNQKKKGKNLEQNSINIVNFALNLFNNFSRYLI